MIKSTPIKPVPTILCARCLMPDRIPQEEGLAEDRWLVGCKADCWTVERLLGSKSDQLAGWLLALTCLHENQTVKQGMHHQQHPLTRQPLIHVHSNVLQNAESSEGDSSSASRAKLAKRRKEAQHRALPTAT